VTAFNERGRDQFADGDSDVSLGSNVLFAVIGAQRTGTNILREILNSNDQIAMLGEVLSPSPAPAHWENFCRNLPVRDLHPESLPQAEELLDRYFEFVRYRIRNYWAGSRKSRSQAFGVDIKYNQLRLIAPTAWNSSFPFMLSYLRSRRAILIHTTRNVVHCAVSTLIASQRNLWHNYDGVVIDRSYDIDVEECLAYARSIKGQRDAFLSHAQGCKVVTCHYESLVGDLERAGSGEEIPDGPGPLRTIASALGGPLSFRYDRSLQKSINVPYSKLLSNYDAFARRLQDSEFASLVSTLD
jgi:LPS sulfotransferase NodH